MLVAETWARNDSGELWRREFHVEDDGGCWSKLIQSGNWSKRSQYPSVEAMVDHFRTERDMKREFLRYGGRIMDAGMLIPEFFEGREAA